MKRREFITLLGGAAATWPLAARAQQSPIPLIGFLSGVSFESYADRVGAFHRGLRESGFVEGQNVAIEYRSAEGRYDRLPELASDLVRRQVMVIVTVGGSRSTQAAMAATATVPIVFATGGDAIETGLVASLNRPKANVTGISNNNSSLGPKRLELLREIVPSATVIGVLINPSSATLETVLRDSPPAARSLGIQLVFLNASTVQEIDTAFEAIAQQGITALAVTNDAFLISRRDQIIGLAARHSLPTIYAARETITAGGLISYSPEIGESHRQAGIYTGRILRGEKPA